MPHPCYKCRFEGCCDDENDVCRKAVFAIADGVDVAECSAKVWDYYRGVEGVFA